MEIIHHIERAQWLTNEESALVVAGWCFCPDANANAVEAYVEGRKIARALLGDRPDVQQHHGGNRHALRSGFKIDLPLLELETVVELRAVLEGPASLPFYSVRVGDLPNHGAIILGYAQWAALRKSEGAAPAESPAARIMDASRPLVSLLLPIYNTVPRFLAECVESVLQQHYPQWELQIVDDGSSDPELRDLLARLAKRDERIQVETSPKNSGISAATNRALARARGEFVGFIDHDDRLHPQALAEVVARLLATNAVAAYTDEEKITSEGAPCRGIFKPDFSPEFLRGVMYLGHFFCVRTSVARAVGGFDARYDGIQDFEFALRVSEYAQAIEHVPQILYQWRISPSSSAQSGNVKGDMDRLQLQAVKAHLARLGRDAWVESLGAHRLRLLPKAGLIPTRTALLVRHAAYLEKIHRSEVHEILILGEVSRQNLVRVLERSRCERLLWVNEPLTSESPSALDALLAFLDEPSVGAVAPVVLAADGKVFASGAIIASGRHVIPAMRGFSPGNDGYHGSLACNREVSAVLSVCVGLRKNDLLENLTETALPFSDGGMAELCLALQRKKLRVLTCAALQFRTERDWAGHGILGEVNADGPDPYYPRQLDANKGDYRLRSGPPPQ